MSLKTVITEAISQANGALSFADFMDLALYSEPFGYYMNAGEKFGPRGDFITAPELGNLFARALTKEWQGIHAALPKASFLEFGAGRGQCAYDLLLAMQALDCLPLHHYIVEISPALQARQETLLRTLPRELFQRISWIQTPPAHFQGLLFGNEVLDAFPVHRFALQNGECLEQVLCLKDEEFISAFIPPKTPGLESAVRALGLTPPSVYISEIRLDMKRWLKPWIESMNAGVVLWVDYGYPAHEYYHPERTNGTFRCFHQHRAHDHFLENLGEQDLTAHVDFTALAEVHADLGLSIEGFCTQTHFLLNCGIDAFLEGDVLTPDLYQQRQQAKMLLLSGEMGEAFKCFAASKNFPSELIGFRQGNALCRL